jgi:hypothetical protein
MSMVFNSAKASDMCCPKCREGNSDDFVDDKDIEWYVQKMLPNGVLANRRPVENAKSYTDVLSLGSRRSLHQAAL